MITEIYDITGMHCAACSAAVERVTRKLPGVVESQVNLTMARLTITYDESQTTQEMICEKVSKAGFGAVLHVETPTSVSFDSNSESDEHKRKLISLIASCVFSALLMIVSMGHMFGMPLPAFLDSELNPQNFAFLQFLLTVPVIVLGKHYYASGFSSLIHGNPNMNTLVALSSVASLTYSVVLTFMLEANPHLVHSLYYESAVVVVSLVSVGKYLESRSELKTKNALRKLSQLAPDTTNLVINGEVKIVPTSKISVGQTILVRAGEHIPLDGIVVEGFGTANESMLTGESMPVEKEQGNPIIGGSLLLSGALYVKVSSVGNETMLAQIIRFVEDAQGKKAPISKTADKVAGVFVPIVMCIALFSGILWLLLGENFAFSLKIFTSVLVIACPCAMGLATPTAIMVGTGLGASQGILVRSGEALETLHDVDVIVFDKTGTVTEGKMSLSDVVAKDMSESKLLSIMYSLEKLSDHPIAKAITSASVDCEGIVDYEVELFDSVSGLGISGRLKDIGQVLLGNRKYMYDNGIDIAEYLSEADRLSSEGKTLVFAAVGGVAVGLVSISDTIKVSVNQTIKNLRDKNIDTVLLTGDNAPAANYIGDKGGFDKVIAEVLPTEKAKVITTLQEQGKRVMMVGDGINDAPALAAADIGVAVGHGSDIAIDSADVIIMHDDPFDICKAISLGKYTIRNIKQNLFWAFCYNVLAIPIAAGVLYNAFQITLTPMIGSVAMSLSSIFVVTNALRLGKMKLE